MNNMLDYEVDFDNQERQDNVTFMDGLVIVLKGIAVFSLLIGSYWYLMLK